ncbi:nuclease-related domain-containing protein [Metabacillus litoralis]|jgi:hypothetical protein|uniref:nuclease-related domain-containing protein n=1 Tax=Metabacillus litoralis TaxID=152268 RepID=UPI00203E2B3D|nr:nuclease-related domain-containing protein [Metabacillus litoralis]MCM3652459.1 NERD domain-containing protein [Metabacillus litoralis]
MLMKPHIEPVELKLLSYLSKRKNLSSKEKLHYLNLGKGYEGESKVAAWLENLTSEWIILYDLLLENNGSLFQIDTLLISQNTIYLFEVKNYEGDFFINADNWYTKSGNEIKNPLLQLKRSVSLFRRLLQDYKLSFSIEAYVIFINPEFTLFQASLNLPIILPTQLNRFMKNLNMSTSILNDKHVKLAERLVSDHIHQSPYTQIPKYDFHQVKKGITCPLCTSFLTSCNDSQLVCEGCGCKEDIEAAVIRNIKQFQLLFPDRKITTSSIHEWCKVIESKKTIRRILKRNYTLVGFGRSSYYIDS